MRKLSVFVGCEESGVVRDAFIAAGHDAYSCDLQPSRGECVDYHFQEDVVECLTRHDPFDIVILHPDCTKMALSGNRHWAGTVEREEQVDWTIDLWKLALTKAKIGVALENPGSVIFPYLKRLGARITWFQPWEHGHPEYKKTGLALHGLPNLRPSNNVMKEMVKLQLHERERVWRMAPGPNRKRDRSRTFEGVAKAMVQQWGWL